jgi:putative nucleotidyltransferase with HDIG domain
VRRTHPDANPPGARPATGPVGSASAGGTSATSVERVAPLSAHPAERVREAPPAQPTGEGAPEVTMLVVDDETHVLSALRRLLRHQPYRLLTTAEPTEALEIIRREPVELVMCDHRMPGMTGIELMQRVKVIRPEAVRIIFTGYLDLGAAVDAINKGEVYRFVTKPWNDDELRLIIRQAVEHHRLLSQNRELLTQVSEQNRGLRQLARELERRVADRTREIERKRDELRSSYFSTIQALAAAVEAKDPYTRGHSESVARYASLIGQTLNLTSHDLEGIRVAGILHDIGKLVLDSTILAKTDDLAPDEWALIREHPRVGAKILKPAILPWAVVPLVYHHHERYDGSGYPEGIKGELIPLGARILAVADSFDAMNSDRSYRARLSPPEILSEMEAAAGRLFDPELVAIFLLLVKRELVRL